MYFLATPAALLFLTERDRGPAEPGAGRSRGASQMTSNDHGGRVPALLQVGGVPLRPIAALVGVALIWGVAFLVVKQMVAQIPPAVLVAWRFSLAAVVVVVCNPRCLRGVTLRALVRSMILGGVLGTGFLLQTWGFETTSVVVGAFITGSVVLLAPVVARVWLGRRFAIRTGSAVALATAGLAMISLRGAHLGLGEALTLGAAALWALHLVALGAWVRADEVYASAVIQLVVVALLAWSVAAVTPGGIDAPSTPSVWFAVIVLGAIATGAALLLLTWAQARVDSTTSAVVLTLEPVFGAAAAVALGGEQFTPVTALGAGAVVVAALMAARAGSTTGPPPVRSASRPLRGPDEVFGAALPAPPPTYPQVVGHRCVGYALDREVEWGHAVDGPE
jgi:drug/metabolite transporter (DMT)-like permease